ncbi:DUF1801 domain-containing protein [Antarcticibacterium arcticum]|uniref:DUF1801 domain-containing protein n=1 Tax=Antarcticibacterium arcticum TaxID=2585771 RepID=A0A5B8YLL6_9FLAO|nr:DUF1801 domain-containing protein [Antarcticibacterium arcticum]QED36619.1 DUF1801 domain-containing protein [Antarcticibacterium arcticum]
MKIDANSPEDYISKIPEDRREAMAQLRQTILTNLPPGFEETMNYGMIGYVIPHSNYPAGYHCDPSMPLPFLNIASQKNFIGLYHMGLYADDKLLDWFQEEYPKYCKSKPDMGKSCIRFKKTNDIPLELIGELCKKMTPGEWIAKYEGVTKP